MREVPDDFLTYVQSEVNRIEVIAGSLALTEREHQKKLSAYDDQDLTEIATEEESAARQLGMVKQICLALGQKVTDLKEGREDLETVGEERGYRNAPVH